PIGPGDEGRAVSSLVKKIKKRLLTLLAQHDIIYLVAAENTLQDKTTCGRGGIGRRARFRSVWAYPRGGSSPLDRISLYRKVSDLLTQQIGNLFLLPETALTLYR